MLESDFEIPMRSQNSRIAAGGTPRRRIPERVGMRGSSQPVTCLSSTNLISFRLDRTVYLIMSG
jgi:hypothetical protein